MDIRFLTLLEFQSVHFYKLITLVILLVAGVMFLLGLPDMKRGELMVLAPVLLVMAWRFAVEFLRLKKAGPAFVHNGELVVSHGDTHRQISLSNIRSVKSQHSIFLVRRYRSWSEHLAFVQFTLNNGERVYSLVESAVLEFPAGKATLAAIQAAVLEAKSQSLAAAAR
ncbi:hypothetical protein ACVW0Y_003656 [Pseudomonas sp. TE3786]